MITCFHGFELCSVTRHLWNPIACWVEECNLPPVKKEVVGCIVIVTWWPGNIKILKRIRVLEESVK